MTPMQRGKRNFFSFPCSVALEFVIFSTPLGKNPVRVEEGFSLDGVEKVGKCAPMLRGACSKKSFPCSVGIVFSFFQRLYGQTARNVRGVNVAVARAPVLLFGLCFPCSVALIFSQLMTPLAWEAFFFWGGELGPLPTPVCGPPSQGPCGPLFGPPKESLSSKAGSVSQLFGSVCGVFGALLGPRRGL